MADFTDHWSKILGELNVVEYKEKLFSIDPNLVFQLEQPTMLSLLKEYLDTNDAIKVMLCSKKAAMNQPKPGEPSEMFVPRTEFNKLMEEFEVQKKILSTIYIGEAATIIRDFLWKIRISPDMVHLFQQCCGLTQDEFNLLKNEVEIHPMARHEVAHIHHKNISKFTTEEIKECFDALSYNKNQVFPGV